MSDEFCVLLTEDEYDEELTELAHTLVVNAYQNDWFDEFERDRDDAVFDHTYGEFHEEYPLSVIEYSESELDAHARSQTKNELNPEAMAKRQAHYLLAKDLTTRMEQTQHELLVIEPSGEPSGLTPLGKDIGSTDE